MGAQHRDTDAPGVGHGTAPFAWGHGGHFAWGYGGPRSGGAAWPPLRGDGVQEGLLSRWDTVRALLCVPHRVGTQHPPFTRGHAAGGAARGQAVVSLSGDDSAGAGHSPLRRDAGMAHIPPPGPTWGVSSGVAWPLRQPLPHPRAAEAGQTHCWDNGAGLAPPSRPALEIPGGGAGGSPGHRHPQPSRATSGATRGCPFLEAPVLGGSASPGGLQLGHPPARGLQLGLSHPPPDPLLQGRGGLRPPEHIPVMAPGPAASPQPAGEEKPAGTAAKGD